MIRHRAYLGLAGVLLAIACGQPDQTAGFVARDSAGVPVVESSAPAWTAGAGWTVDTIPSLSIGAVSGPAELSLSDVSGVARLPDGSIVVGDGGSNELRFFDPAGAFVRRFGGTGEGPGEFRGFQGMGVSGDTIWVYDLSARRLTFVDAGTNEFRSAPIAAQTFPAMAGRRTDGSFVFGGDVRPGPGRPPEPGFRRADAAYVRVTPTGETTDTLLRAVGNEMLLQMSGDQIQAIRPMFNHSASHTVVGDQLIYGDQDRFELRVYGPAGALARVMRRTDVDLALTDAEYVAAAEARIERSPEQVRPALRKLYFEEQPRPATRPAYARILADADGNLWVQDFLIDDMSAAWSVFDADGAWLGVVTMPERFRPTQIRSDEILGVWRDELDVEFARAYPLHRGPS